MKHDMQGKVVVVTGASAGVGRATVRAFAARGASVGLIARGRDGLEAARREVEGQGGRAVVLALDVADAAAVDQAAEDVEQTLGPIDVWVNDAMAFRSVRRSLIVPFRCKPRTARPSTQCTASRSRSVPS